MLHSRGWGVYVGHGHGVRATLWSLYTLSRGGDESRHSSTCTPILPFSTALNVYDEVTNFWPTQKQTAKGLLDPSRLLSVLKLDSLA